jgi:hypothetical protein
MTVCDRCTYDQPHTHDERKWVPANLDKVKVGDTVRLEHGDGSVLMRQVGISKSVALLPEPFGSQKSLAWLLTEMGWSLFVEAPPTPQQPELPDEAGIYVTRGEHEWNKTPLFKVAGGWQFANGQDATETARMWHTDAGLVRLEPQATTAKAVLDRLVDKAMHHHHPDAETTHVLHTSDFANVATEFGA